MRGEDERSGSLFSYVDLEGRVGKDHPLRTIRGVVNEALASLSSEFSGLYARMLGATREERKTRVTEEINGGIHGFHDETNTIPNTEIRLGQSTRWKN